ncbi:hypothetical protein BCR34DRAFT_589071 [Clohesyomyces aquaticus]|uniref:Uncharacterized protein n=1 Tax=Clohesyomyces aquaticus TaxID=1231657 RepID=A0A1Y1ZHJ8_9PLEO|nr:hypothetical protein BCR34DRAFT_589071 [Clohesyomyces aquaticus]
MKAFFLAPLSAPAAFCIAVPNPTPTPTPPRPFPTASRSLATTPRATSSAGPRSWRPSTQLLPTPAATTSLWLPVNLSPTPPSPAAQTTSTNTTLAAPRTPSSTGPTRALLLAPCEDPGLLQQRPGVLLRLWDVQSRLGE